MNQTLVAKCKPPVIDLNDARRALRKLTDISNPVAGEIIKILIQNIDRPDLSQTDIRILLRMEQSVVSLHLGKLVGTGIVDEFRAGKWIYYSINQKEMEKVARISKALAVMFDEDVDVRMDSVRSTQIWRKHLWNNPSNN